MTLFLLLVIGLILSISGEALCKMGSIPGEYSYLYTIGASLVWGSASIVWTQIYKLKTITEILAMYNPVYLIVLAMTGIVLFNEPLTMKIAIAFCLVAICVWLLY